MSGSNLVSKLPTPPDPSFEVLRQLLEGHSLNNLPEIEAEVRRLCIVAFVVGNQHGMAYALQMDKSDEALEEGSL